MTLTKYRPIRARNHFPAFPNLLDEFFNKDVSSFLGTDSVCTSPNVNVIENDDNYMLEVAAPGFSKNHFELNLEKNVLTISGNVESKNEENSHSYTRREFCTESFNRSFTLPDSVDSENITATYVNGILNVTVPKKEESKPIKKTISIK